MFGELLDYEDAYIVSHNYAFATTQEAFGSHGGGGALYGMLNDATPGGGFHQVALIILDHASEYIEGDMAFALANCKVWHLGAGNVPFLGCYYPCTCVIEPPVLCPECSEQECICPPIVQPPPDLSDVGMKEEDGKVILTNIDEDTIDEHRITFRWWRRVGDGEWELVPTPPSQPWVIIELHPDDDVTYKCEIIVRDEFQLARERSFVPPIPRTNILRNPVLWAVAGILAILGILFIIIAINKRDEKRKKIQAVNK